MNSIGQQLSKQFGEKDIKISLSNQPFNVHETGKSFFAEKKDVQVYVYEDSVGLQAIRSFNKNTPQTLAWLIALCYCNGELGRKFPTDLICVSGARNSSERNEDGTFNGTIYHLTSDQIEEIADEYDLIV